jgi:hypothetical protein
MLAGGKRRKINGLRGAAGEELARIIYNYR